MLCAASLYWLLACLTHIVQGEKDTRGELLHLQAVDAQPYEISSHEAESANSNFAGLLLALNPIVGSKVSSSLSDSSQLNSHAYSPIRQSVPVRMGKKAKGGKQQQLEKKKKIDARINSFKGAYTYTILGLTKQTPDKSRTLLKDIDLCFMPGAKIGVVGLNGAGKSTLLRIMAGVDKDFDGTAEPSKGITVGYLPQEPTLDGETVGESIDKGVEKGRALLKEFDALSAKLSEPLDDEEMTETMEKLSETQEKIEAGNLWELDRVVERASLALRCPPSDAKNDVLSGGEKRRVALARLLLENNDVLLLDEPTNHLDAQSVAWLQTFLQEFKGTVVAITHDRYFLENSCEWILELERGEGKPFKGCYSGWLEQKAKLMEEQKKAETKLAKTVAAELEWVRSNPKARQAKSKSRLARYDDLVNAPKREDLAHAATIYIPPGPHLGTKVIKANHVKKSFGDRVLIEDLSFEVPPGGIVGVVGPNGAGKTTLIKMFKGEEMPDSGELELGESVKLVSIEQTREGLEDTNSVFEEITGATETIDLGSSEVPSRAYVSWFGFKGQDQQKKVSQLSGGERNRVQLGKLLRVGGNLLLLDEPTNDLDVDTMRALEDALLDFGGSVVVVSHDRFFLDRLCTHILAAEGEGKWTFFEGNYQEYEDDRKERLGDEEPKPMKYATLA